MQKEHPSQEQILKSAATFVSKHRNRHKLNSKWTALSYKDQQNVFFHSLHDNNTGFVFLPSLRKFDSDEDKFYEKDGFLHEKSSWDNSRVVKLGTLENISSRIVKNKMDYYINVNPMDGTKSKSGIYQRTDMACMGISGMSLDVDILPHLEKYDEKLANDVISVALAILLRVLPAPQMVTLTGHGFTWIYRYNYLIPNPTERDKHGHVMTLNPAVSRHDEMYAELVKCMQGFFDPEILFVNATTGDHARVIRHAGTYNTAAGKYCTLLINNPDRLYNPEELYYLLRLPNSVKPGRIEQPKDIMLGCNESVHAKAKIDEVYKGKTIADDRLPGVPVAFYSSAAPRIRLMQEIPNKVSLTEGTGRHKFIFVFYCHARIIYTWDEAVTLTRELNNRFTTPLEPRDFDDQINRVDRHTQYSAWRNKMGDGCYVFKTKTMLEFLPISIDMAREIGFLAYSDKIERFAKHQEQAKERDYAVARMWLSGYSHQNISDMLQGVYPYVCRESIKRITKKLGLTPARDTDWDTIDFEGNARYLHKNKNNKASKHVNLDEIPEEELELNEEDEELEISAELELQEEEKKTVSDSELASEKEDSHEKKKGENHSEALLEGTKKALSIKKPKNLDQNLNPVQDSESGLNPKPVLPVLTDEQTRIVNAILYSKNYFLSGMAGTGKSFVLSEVIRLVGKDRVLILAPSGKAAADIQGKTIHNGLKLENRPFGPDEDIPSCCVEALYHYDYVVIDEIGMVRFDLFQKVMNAVRTAEVVYNKCIHVICMGDFNQINPVMTDEDHFTLMKLWNNPDIQRNMTAACMAPSWVEGKFWENSGILTYSKRHELDSKYADALSAVYREYQTDQLVDYLNEKVRPELRFDDTRLHLCGYCKTVEMINNSCISKHTSDPSYTIFHAGHAANLKLDESAYPVPFAVTAYIGMPVMTTINRARYKNGTYGVITEVMENGVVIQTTSGKKIPVRATKIRPYDISMLAPESRPKNWNERKELEITQVPITPAYAVTYHKAQGMTIDSAIIHPQFWDVGQLYVAISRVKTHNGLFFTDPVQKTDIRSNPLGLLIMQYMECNRTAELTQILSPIQNRSNEMVLDILQSDAYFVPECCQTRNACIDPYMDGLYVPVNTVNIPVIEMPKYMTQIENIC